MLKFAKCKSYAAAYGIFSTHVAFYLLMSYRVRTAVVPPIVYFHVVYI